MRRPQLIRRPLVPAALAFVAGVTLAAPGSATVDLVVAAGLGLLGWGLASARRILAGLLLPLVFFGLGLGVGGLRPRPEETVSDAFGGALPESRVILEGVVVEPPEVDERGTRYVLDLAGVGEGPIPGALVPASGRVRMLVRAPRDPDAPRPPPKAGAGDRVRAHAKLRAPSPAAFPGAFAARRWAERAGFALFGSASGPERVVVVARGERPLLLGDLHRLRARVHRAIDRALEPDAAGLVRALATGDRGAMSEDATEAVRDAGLAHLTAVSGFHLGVVAWLWVTGLGALFRRWRAVAEGFGADRLAAVLGLPVVIVYPLFVGGTPSAVRAGIMFAMVLLARVARRGREAWSALAAALMAMVAWDPACLGGPGFQLSFAAVAALLRIPPAVERGLGLSPQTWPGPARFAWTAAMASVAATLGTAPFVALHFGRLSVIGLLTNIPAGLIAAVAVPFALGGGLVAAVAPDLGEPLLAVAGAAAEALLTLARVSADLPGAVWTLPPPKPLELLLFFATMVTLTLPGASRRVRRAGWALAVALLLVTASVPLRRLGSTETRVTFLPVGQGDGAVLELPGGKVVVIDAGPGHERWDAGERVLAPFLRARRISRVDLFIATHPHADHVGGLPGLLEAVPVAAAWWTGDDREGPDEALEALARLPVERVRPGRVLEAGPARLEVLGPRHPPGRYSEVNDASIVVRLVHGRRTLLLTGDAEREGEAELVGRYGETLAADVLKAGHHGSRSSSTRPFLERVAPDHVVISCGRGNVFQFPHPEALERIGDEREVWRTDQRGAITVLTDGEELEVRAFLEAR